MGFGKRTIKSRGRPLSPMAQIKTSFVEVNASENYLAHAIIIEKAKAHNYPDNKAYGQGRKILPVVRKMLAKTGIDLSGGWTFTETKKIP